MNKLKVFKKLRLWFVVGFILALLAILILGYLLDWPLEVQILSVVILIFLFLLIIVSKSLRAAHRAQKVDMAIRAQATAGMDAARQREIEQFRKKMLAAIQSLKKSKLSKSGREKSNLYSLPWYILFGTESSGKTTLIGRSGLNFPFGIEIGKTKDCDWFFANSAVFIDTAAFLTKEDERGTASGEWYALLETLCKYRKRKPLNGIIVSVNLSDLIDADPDDVESMAKNLRNRVNELVHYSGFHLPLYLVFTKCDLIEGFEEFFKEFKSDDLRQMWGYTFSEKVQTGQEMVSRFEIEFQKLYQTLSHLRLKNLTYPNPLEHQRRIFNFPENFCSLKQTLSKFVGKLFQPNFYAENPLFRGFYFTSAIQTQLSADRAAEEIEMQFNPETHITQHREIKHKPRIYFIADLFSRLIVPDRHLAKPTSRMILRAHFKKISLAAVTVALLAFFLFNVIHNAIRNTNDIIALKAIVNTVNRVDWNQEPAPVHFKALNRLYSYIIHLRDAPFLAGRIYQGHRLITAANQIYFDKFTPLFSNYLYRDMLSRYLQDYVRNSPSVSRDQAYEYLRAYLLLDTHVDKLRSVKAESEFLKNLMASLVDSLFVQKFNMPYQITFNENGISSARSLLQKEVVYFVDILSTQDEKKRDIPFNNDQGLVERVRRTLGKPSISDIYARIKREGMVDFEKISVDQMLPECRDLFDVDATLSGFFSKNAWKSFVSREIDKSSKNPGRDDWVLNVEASELPDELRDAGVMEEKLEEKYFHDYAKQWWGFLGQIRYIPFKDAKEASDQLSLLGDFIDSPLRKLLNLVTSETRFEGVIDQKTQEVKTGLGLDAKQHLVDSQFRSVHALSEDEGGILADLLGQFNNLSGLMEELSEETGENSARNAASVLQQGSGDIPDALQSIRRSLRRFDQNARECLFEKPVLMAWAIVLDGTQQYLDQQWDEQVYQPYMTMVAHHYPVDRNATTETSPADFANFFRKNNGIFWDFVTKELEPFLKKKSWNPEVWEGSGIVLSNRFKTALQKATEITEGLGLDNQDNLRIDFKILPQLPVSKVSGVEQITLSIDGKDLVYRMGRPLWENFSWPNPENVSSARLEVRTKIASYRPQQFDGNWAWFRLLDQAITQQSTSSQFNVEWRFPPDQNYEIQARFKIDANSINNPFGTSDFFSISLPPSLSPESM